MKSKIKKVSNIAVFMVLLLIATPFVMAFDLSDYGSFSERSTIMQSMNKKERLTQEQKDTLKERKLAPNVACLIDQIKKKNIENVILLLDCKVNPNESYYADYPIYIAAKENNFEIVKLLFERKAKLDKGFNSELYEAVKNKNSEMAQFLLDNNARVNYQDSLTQNTILYYALKNNMTDIALQLLERGAGLDVKSKVIIKKKKPREIIEYIESKQ